MRHSCAFDIMVWGHHRFCVFPFVHVCILLILYFPYLPSWPDLSFRLSKDTNTGFLIVFTLILPRPSCSCLSPPFLFLFFNLLFILTVGLKFKFFRGLVLTVKAHRYQTHNLNATYIIILQSWLTWYRLWQKVISILCEQCGHALGEPHAVHAICIYLQFGARFWGGTLH